jgi:poly(A) polymerase Pap1
LRLFGSYALGTHIFESDIYVYACIRLIDPDTTYLSLLESTLLQDMNTYFIENLRIKNSTVITTATVPLLKFKHEGIHFDVILALMNNGEPANAASSRNIAGVLLVEDILRRVPNRLYYQ